MSLSKIRIERKSQLVNKARAIAIFIDGMKVGTLKDGEIKDFEISRASVKVYAKLDWCKTPPLQIKGYGSAIAHVEVGCNVKGRSASLLTSVSLFTYALYGVYRAFWKPSEYLYIKETYNIDIFKWSE